MQRRIIKKRGTYLLIKRIQHNRILKMRLSDWLLQQCFLVANGSILIALPEKNGYFAVVVLPAFYRKQHPPHRFY